MKKIHRVALALTAVVLALSLTACGGKGKSTDIKSGSEPNVTVPNITVVNNGGDNTVKASGTISEQTYVLNGGPYTVKASGISMSDGNCALVISPADDGNCIVTVDDNVNITVNVNEDAKRIEVTGESGKSFEGLNLKIAVNAVVEAIDLDGAFEVTYDAGTTEQVEITASGACQITAAGQCQTGKYTLSGVTQLKAYELKCGELTVSTEGVCAAEVYASQSLTATASGTSKVCYDGNPQETSIDASSLSSIEPR